MSGPVVASSTGRKPRVLSIGEPSWADPTALENFKTKFDIHVVKPDGRAGTVKAVADAAQSNGPFDAVLILMGNGAYDPFNAELFGPLAPHCKIMASVNAGYSEFDLEWFNKNKIYVTNTVNAVAEPTADITMFLILAVLRDTSETERVVRQDGWRNISTPLRDPNGLVLGIFGMGKIGKHVARLSRAFGMKVHYYNRTQVPSEEEKALEATYHKALKSLLATSDVVCINCPLTEQTRGMIGEAEIACMKDGAFLVNTGRGPVVEEKALITALWSG